tara:strand:- start:1340 stop:2143 length:804 start_codon:yes stop_codon:yes gene_type:complete
MFKDYSDLFDQRGDLYHQAMRDCPRARKVEFDTATSWLDLCQGMTICDIPSGGCYLADFILQDNITLYSVETSHVFFNEGRNYYYKDDNNDKKINCVNVMCDSIAVVPLVAGIADRILSLSGLHHQTNPLSFYKEAARLLTDDGFLVLADVRAGSDVDRFLNQFVDQHSSAGHEGIFLNKQTLLDIESCGFKIIDSKVEKYNWNFSCTAQMVSFCKKLFGLDKADEETILAGIKNCMGYSERKNGCSMHWELIFIKAAKSVKAPLLG